MSQFSPDAALLGQVGSFCSEGEASAHVCSQAKTLNNSPHAIRRGRGVAREMLHRIFGSHSEDTTAWGISDETTVLTLLPSGRLAASVRGARRVRTSAPRHAPLPPLYGMALT